MENRFDWLFTILGKATAQAIIFIAVMFFFFHFVYKEDKGIKFYAILFGAMLLTFFLTQTIRTLATRKKHCTKIESSCNSISFNKSTKRKFFTSFLF